jgi:hypothetical protein
MSEYQYYEFQAIDRPLDEREMRALRQYSTRATITPTRFVNFYDWGNFKGDPDAWMQRYFDAFLYFAGWGERLLMLRLPRRLLDPKTARRYCRTESVSVRITGDFVVLSFLSGEPQDDDDADDGEGWLSSLIPLRADLTNGDQRALYLAWLLAAQKGELDDEDPEPPCPAGLRKLSAPLRAFADFLCIDQDLLATAAERSAKPDDTVPAGELRRWVAGLPDTDKTALLMRLVKENEPHLRVELLRRFRDSRQRKPTREPARPPRTVAELLEAAEQRAEERRHQEAARARRAREQAERKEAAARARYLDKLARREAEAWRKIDALIATRQPGRYDEAVTLLKDLWDMGRHQGRAAGIERRIRRLQDKHAGKPSLLDRLRRAGLGTARTRTDPR